MLIESAVALIMTLGGDPMKKEMLDINTNTVYIYNDPGGYMHEYIHRIQYYKTVRIFVNIKGECKSACTMFIHLKESGLVCADPDARFHFHQARINGKLDMRNSDILLEHYPKMLQTILKNKGFYELKNNEWLVVKATDVVPACKG